MLVRRFENYTRWFLFSGLLVAAAAALLSLQWLRAYLFPPAATTFQEMTDEGRAASWEASWGGDQGDFMRIEFERRPLLGPVPLGSDLEARMEMLNELRLAGLRLVAVDKANLDVVVDEVSLRQGNLSEPQRTVTVHGVIRREYRGWYVEYLLAGREDYGILYTCGKVGARSVLGKGSTR